jgi:hypothetical protein
MRCRKAMGLGKNIYAGRTARRVMEVDTHGISPDRRSRCAEKNNSRFSKRSRHAGKDRTCYRPSTYLTTIF